MFKGAVGDKQQRKVEDVFTSMNGKRFSRADVENPDRAGFLRDELVPIEPDVWSAGSYFNLLTPTHKRMRPLQPSPDPAHIRQEEAPVDKREKLAAAEAKLEKQRGKVRECQDRIHAADVAAQMATVNRANDPKAYNRAIAVGTAAETELPTLLAQEQLDAAAVADEKREITEWLRREGISRARPFACSCGGCFTSLGEAKRHEKEHYSR